jgi:hypothetical protein
VASRMEHRLSIRRESNERVLIYQLGQCIGPACIRNTSRHGMLVEFGNSPSISRGCIEIEFTTRDLPTRLRAMVIHHDETRLGVMLMDEWPVDQVRVARASPRPSAR